MRRITHFGLALLALSQITCGAEVSTTTPITPATKVESLSGLPSINVGNYISAAGAVSVAQSLSTSKSVNVSKAQVGTTGTFSRAGCECRQIKKELVHQGKQIELNNCYVQTIGKAKNLEIPEDKFGYHKMTLAGEETMLVRLGNFRSGLVTTFQMDLCQVQSSTPSQVISFDVTVDGGTVSGSIINKFPQEGQAEPDQSSFDFNIGNYSESASGFNFDTATFASAFNGQFGSGNSALTANKTSGINKVTGSFKNGVGDNDFTAHLTCQFDKSNGAAKYDVTGIFPAFSASSTGIPNVLLEQLGFSTNTPLCPNNSFDETKSVSASNNPFTAPQNGSCNFSANDTEAFELTSSGASGEGATIIASSGTNHFNVINNTALSSGSVTTPVIPFTRSWDCTADEGFAVVDARDVDISTCKAIEDDLESTTFESSCDQQGNGAKISESQSLPPSASSNESPPAPECAADNPCPSKGQICVEGTCVAEEVRATCGNGAVEEGEQCDDGNTIDGDCCNATCQFETNESACDDENSCTLIDQCNGEGLCTSSGSPCANGSLEELCGEQCDDNNTNSGDGCNSTCQNEICGDGSVNNGGAEQCDDGNTDNDDGCNSTCQNEICGDSVLHPGEECDDGNTDNGDGCQANCLNPFCGDSVIDADAGEYCDDGNTEDGDGCNTSCQPECLGDTSRTVFGGGSGSEGCQGFADDQTACEEGYNEGRNGVASCYWDDNDGWCYGCGPSNEDSGNCTNTCRVPVCGDGYINGEETCDDGNTDPADGCEPDCTPTPE
ncbi:MAG: DUF4215 domain-containing protein [Deltaproteobacteria bacterium]|nr:DUF4215 domain-containing protein [Deltaproteobacteria bacterium]